TRRPTRSIRRPTLSPMAMGKRQRHAKQASMWVATQDLPRSAAHPFYVRLNQILDAGARDPVIPPLGNPRIIVAIAVFITRQSSFGRMSGDELRRNELT